MIFFLNARPEYAPAVSHVSGMMKVFGRLMLKKPRCVMIHPSRCLLPAFGAVVRNSLEFGAFVLTFGLFSDETTGQN
jgi:hypothetical protein